MAVVLSGWVLFRVEKLRDLKNICRVLFLGVGGPFSISMFMDTRIFVLLALALMLCGPLQALCPKLKDWLYREDQVGAADVAAMAGILSICLVLLVCNTYNPFIYFRF